MFQRLAEVHEKLGKLDEAYRQLLEADKMGPGQLLTKLSLGENRFRAGKWREAAPAPRRAGRSSDAAIYPDEVADALAHGGAGRDQAAPARARHRALRGGAAPARRAPRRRCARWPIWRSSAASGRRPPAICAAWPKNPPTAPSAPRRWSSSAICYVELDDEAQALNAYSDAHKASVAAAGGAGPLLEKTLKLQRASGDSEAAAQTSALLIDLVKDPKERAERRRDAALILAEHGEVKEAAALLDKALEENPHDEEALLGAVRPGRSTVAPASAWARSWPGRWPSCRQPADQPAARTRRARLWQRRGELLRGARSDGGDGRLRAGGGSSPPTSSRRARRWRRSTATIPSTRRRRSRTTTRAPRRRHHPLRPRCARSAPSTRGAAWLTGARCCHEMLALLGTATPPELAFLQANPPPELEARRSLRLDARRKGSGAAPGARARRC